MTMGILLYVLPLMLFVREEEGLKQQNRQSVLVVRWSWRTRTSRSITEPIATRV